MQNLSRLIPAMPEQILLAAMKPRPGEARMGLGRRKEPSPFSDTSCMIARMKDFVWFRRIEVTAANVHDSQVDLAEEGEVRYADKGFSGAKTKGYDAAMKKATRGHPLSNKDKMRNRRISRKRSPVERFYAFIKCVCKAGHVAVTTIPRVRVKVIITGIVFNVYHLASAKSKLEA